jgi:hypothetical protein
MLFVPFRADPCYLSLLFLTGNLETHQRKEWPVGRKKTIEKSSETKEKGGNSVKKD